MLSGLDGDNASLIAAAVLRAVGHGDLGAGLRDGQRCSCPSGPGVVFMRSRYGS